MSMQDINILMRDLAEYQRLNDELEIQIESLKDEIKQYMIENDLAVLNGLEHKATYSAITTKRLDTKALKNDHSEIVEKYMKTSVSNRFTFK